MAVSSGTTGGKVAAPIPATQIPKGAWTIATLLLLFMLVNFADKVVVGLAGVPIMKELGLNQTDFGFLGSAFFFLFSITGVIGGFIVNRVQTRWVLLGLATVWALVQFPMLTTVSYSTLLICRIILGAGEGPAYAVAVHALYKWFPDEKRAMPTALLSQGSAFGVILAVPSLNWLVVNYTWHAAFGALGVVGLLWALAWLALGREGPLTGYEANAIGTKEARVPYGKLLASPTFIGCVVSTFGAYWALSVGLTWFTPFLVQGLGYSQKEAGLISVLPWLAGATVVMLTGWLSQTMYGRGIVTRYSRGVIGSVPLILGGLVLLLGLPLATDRAAQVALLVLGTGLCGSIYVVCPPMIGEIAPVAQRGAVLAIYGALYALAGVLAPFIMGKVLDSAASPLDGYMTGYKLLAIIQITAGVLGLLLLRPNWDRARIMRPVAA